MTEPPQSATLINVLWDDMAHEFRNHTTPRGRRAAVRAMFATIEAVLWTLKQDILEYYGHRLTSAEKQFLQEEQISIRENGELRLTPLPLRFKANVKATVKLLSKVDPDLDIEFGEGWADLLNALDIRHRLTHPKMVEDLDVTDEQLVSALDGLGWFMSLRESGWTALIEAWGKDFHGRSRLMAKLLEGFVAPTSATQVQKPPEG